MLRNKRNQGMTVKVFKGTEHVATIERQILRDKSGMRYCNYNGTRHVVTRIERVSVDHGTTVEYRICDLRTADCDS